MVNFTMLVRNRPRLTAQALDSLITTENCWITVLDDRSEDETQAVLKSYPGMFLRERNETPMGTGALRNLAIHSSEVYFERGECLYLSDNDVRFNSQIDWLGILVAAYEAARKNGFMVLGAYNHPYHVPIATEYCGRFEIREVQALALQSMLMSWDIWDKYGPFCETPEGKVCQGEDVDFTNKIKADGGRLGVVSPPLLVNTGITNSFGEKIPGWEMVKAQCPAGVICE